MFWLRVARYFAAVFTPLAIILAREGLFGPPAHHGLKVRLAWWLITLPMCLPALCVIVLSAVHARSLSLPENA